MVEETQFDKLPQENEEIIQSASDTKASDLTRAGPSGLNRSPPSHRRSTRSSTTIPDESSVLVAEKSSEENTRLAESFTALRNALQDEQKP